MPEASILPESSTLTHLVLPQESSLSSSLILVCPWTDSVEVSAHTFPVDTITLEYSWVKATTVSVRLQIYSQSLKYPTDVAIMIAPELLFISRVLYGGSQTVLLCRVDVGASSRLGFVLVVVLDSRSTKSYVRWQDYFRTVHHKEW